MTISNELFQQLVEVSELDDEDLTSFGNFVIYNSDAKELVNAIRSLEIIRSLLFPATAETIQRSR